MKYEYINGGTSNVTDMAEYCSVLFSLILQFKIGSTSELCVLQEDNALILSIFILCIYLQNIFFDSPIFLNQNLSIIKNVHQPATLPS